MNTSSTSKLVLKLLLSFLSAEFEDDPDLYVLRPIKYIGIEVWQVSIMLQLITVLEINVVKISCWDTLEVVVSYQ